MEGYKKFLTAKTKVRSPNKKKCDLAVLFCRQVTNFIPLFFNFYRKERKKNPSLMTEISEGYK